MRGEAEGHWQVYGSELESVRGLAGSKPVLLHSRLPYQEAEVRWAARHEMARTVEDVLSRRTRALLLDARASAEIAPRVAELLAAELKRPADWAAQQVDSFRQLAARYLV
jgi:glycerol-3-phosphate dehydrogenase